MAQRLALLQAVNLFGSHNLIASAFQLRISSIRIFLTDGRLSLVICNLDLFFRLIEGFIYNPTRTV